MTRLLLLAPLLLAACVPEPDTRMSGSAEEGALLFAQNCAACHGAAGTGAGPAAEGLSPPPADLTRIAERRGGAFPPDFVMSAINGFHRDAAEGTAMPEWGLDAFGPLAVIELEPGVGTPVPLGLLALSRYLESIQQPAAAR